jgi:prepilin-type N-terminal cleavage/methylation domain-containing protein
MKPHPAGIQKGFSLLELLLASFIGLSAMSGILYLYKAQHKNMTLLGGLAETRMNGQFTLNETQYYLSLIGLGLPHNLRCLTESNGDLVIRLNSSKKSSAANMDPSSDAFRTVFRIPAGNAPLFSGRSYAAAMFGGSALEARITGIAPRPGSPAEALITLEGDKAGFSTATTLYPVERIRLHRCTGIGMDTAEGDFKILHEDPSAGSDSRKDSLKLAEGIESLSYRYLMIDGAEKAALPSKLDSLQRIEVMVVAKSKFSDRAADGDGYKRDTLIVKVNYHRSI